MARALGVPVPAHLRRHKGWIGQLVEAALGATAGSRPEPDFPELGIELKTVPVDGNGAPRESTYVCVVRMDGGLATRWEDSWVRSKLARVLWVPVVGDGKVAPGDRTLGEPVLWSPTPDQEGALRADWESLAEMIGLGEWWQITAYRGEVLQVRPKAASGKEMTWMLDDEGEWVQVNPRGFYLRRGFTRSVLEGQRAAN